MRLLIIAFLPLLACIVYIFWSVWNAANTKRAHQRKLEKMRLSSERVSLLSRYCKLWEKLSPTEQKELSLLVDRFLETFPIHPAGHSHTPIANDLRYGVASNACLLVLAEKQKMFPDLRCVFVLREDSYDLNDPLLFQGKETLIDEDHHPMTLNEAVYGGNLILTARQITDCGGEGEMPLCNAVLLAFADNLNTELIDNMSSTLSQVLFCDMGKRVRLSDLLLEDWNEMRQQPPADFPEYATDNIEAFFREVTNAYFENSDSLAQNHPSLYLKMAETYGLLEYQKKPCESWYTPAEQENG